MLMHNRYVITRFFLPLLTVSILYAGLMGARPLPATPSTMPTLAHAHDSDDTHPRRDGHLEQAHP